MKDWAPYIVLKLSTDVALHTAGGGDAVPERGSKVRETSVVLASYMHVIFNGCPDVILVHITIVFKKFIQSLFICTIDAFCKFVLLYGD